MKKILLLYKSSIKQQLSYKKNLLIELCVWFIYSLLPLLVVNLFIDNEFGDNHFSNIINIMYGVIFVSYNFSRMVARGFDNYQKILFSGDLDVYFTRPLPIITQVLASELFLRRLSGIIIGVFAIINGYRNGFDLSLYVVMVLLVSLIITYIGLMLISSALLLITTQGTMLTSLLVDSSSNFGFYPTEMLKNPARFLFTYVVPIYYCLYYPIQILSVEKGNYNAYFYPLMTSFLVLIIGVLSFNYMLSKYESNNR